MHRDVKLLTNGTDNHLILIDLRDRDISGQELEDRFIKGGVQGTITMNDDGSDGLYNKNIVNNLSTYVINNF